MNQATRKSPNHFEQVPLDVVKEIAEVDGPVSSKTPDRLITERRRGKKDAGTVPPRSAARKKR